MDKNRRCYTLKMDDTHTVKVWENPTVASIAPHTGKKSKPKLKFNRERRRAAGLYFSLQRFAAPTEEEKNAKERFLKNRLAMGELLRDNYPDVETVQAALFKGMWSDSPTCLVFTGQSKDNRFDKITLNGIERDVKCSNKYLSTFKKIFSLEEMDELYEYVEDIFGPGLLESSLRRQAFLLTNSFVDKKVKEATQNNLSKTDAIAFARFCVQDLLKGTQKAVADLDLTTKQIVISTPEQLEHYLDKLMERGGKGYYYNHIAFHNNGEHETFCMPADYTVLADYLEETFEKTYMINSRKGTLTYKERYSRAVLGIELENSEAVPYWFGEKEEFREIYRAVDPDGNDTFWLVRNDGMLVNILDEYVEPLTFKQFKEYAKFGFWLYDGAYGVSTPGTLKKHTALMFGKYYGPNEEWSSFDAEGFLDDIFGGTLDIYLSAEDKVTYQSIAKFASRLGHWLAPAAVYDRPVRCIGLYGGKFTSQKILDMNGKPLSFNDGCGYGLDEFLALCYTDKLGKNYLVLPTACTGRVNQERYLNYCNKQDTVYTDRMGMYSAMQMYSEDIPIRLCTPLMTEKEKSAVTSWMYTGGKTTGFENEDDCWKWQGRNVLIYTDIQSFEEGLPPDYYTDFNCTKAPTKPWKTLPQGTVLQQAHNDGGVGVTSTQQLQTLLYNNQNVGTLILAGLAGVMIAREKIKLLDISKPKRVSCAEFRGLETYQETVNEDGSIERTLVSTGFSQIIDQITPEYALSFDHRKWKRQINMTFKKLSKLIGKLNIPCSVKHLVLVPDLAAHFGGVALLGITKEGIVEFYGKGLPGCITEEEYIKRVHESDMTEDQKSVVINMIKCIAPGTLVAPVKEVFTRANEGSDWDSDSQYIFYMCQLIKQYLAEEKGCEVTEITWAEVTEYCRAQVRVMLSKFDGETEPVMVDTLTDALKAEIKGEIIFGQRYPKNFSRGVAKMAGDILPMICVYIDA